MQRIRIHFTKGTELQYTGNLDLHKIWERTFRRARLPLAYSQGFHPQPKIQLASALPLGFTSREELADVWLDTDMDLPEIERILTGIVQPGLVITKLEAVSLYDDALQNRVQSSEFEITFLEPVDYASLSQRITTIIESSSIQRERRDKPYDLRLLIEKLELHSRDGNPSIFMRLAARPGATGRPEEVLDELGIDPYSVEIERTALLLSD